MNARDQALTQTSIWRIRGTALAVAALVVFLVLALMASPLRYDVAVPGPLASFHAPLAESCVDCHSLAPDAIASAWRGIGETEDRVEQSGKCLHCHQIGAQPLRPHAWSLEGQRLVRASSGVAADGAGPRPEAQIACATCHHEHRGRLADLKAMDSARCHSCHTEAFDSFESGHPEFTDFPASRPGAVRFDHRAHIQRHFNEDPTQASPQSCTDCHAPDAEGGEMLLHPFEQTCAACHEAEIRGSSQVDGKGLAVLSLPSLDVYSFEPLGIGIGRWPADADYGEVLLSPFMELLLSHTETSQRDLQLFRSVDPMDLTDASDPEVIAVARTALRIKGLLRDLQPGGHAALHERLEAVVGRELQPSETAELMGEIPSEVIRQALDHWLPDLENDHSCEETVLTKRVPEGTDSEPIDFDLDDDHLREGWMTSGGWYRQDLDCTVRYRPRGHADPFLRAWIEWSAGARDSLAAEHLFESLTGPQAVGRCGKCHVDPSAGSWSAALESSSSHGVTRFSHSVHFPVLGERGCLTCHELLEPESPGSGAPSEPSKQAARSFGPMKVQSCVACHSARGASSECMTCHDYHAVRPSMGLPLSPLTLLDPGER